MSADEQRGRPAAVVMAAGKGTRMRSQHPKVLHTVAGEPMIAHTLRLLHGLAIAPSDIVIVVGYGAAEILAYLADPAPFVAGTPAPFQPGDLYRFATQAEQKGTAHAVLMAKPLLAERTDVDSVLILNGDAPLLQYATMEAFLAAHYATPDLPFLTFLTAIMPDPTGYGRVVRDDKGWIAAVVEEKDATPAERAIHESNMGIYISRPDFLWSALERVPPSPVSGEYYLPELVAMAVASRRVEVRYSGHEDHAEGIVRSLVCAVGGDATVTEPGDVVYTLPDVAALDEFHGINDRAQLARATAALYRRTAAAHMAAGVTITDPAATYIGAQVEIGADTTIEPNTHLRGRTHIGTDCTIGPNAILTDATIGDGCTVMASVIELSTLEAAVTVGPFSRLRGNTYIEAGAHIGNFGEMKNTRFGRGSKAGHFSYLGDATIGANVNIGAGTITANYDGKAKHPTYIGDNAFIGSDTILRAPVSIGTDAGTGAGSVVTKDVPDGGFVVGVPARPFHRADAAENEGVQE